MEDRWINKPYLEEQLRKMMVIMLTCQDATKEVQTFSKTLGWMKIRVDDLLERVQDLEDNNQWIDDLADRVKTLEDNNP